MQKNRTPDISFLIPTKNRAELCKSCVNTIVQSGVINYEIVISDNCSEQSYDDLITGPVSKNINYQRLATPVSVTQNWELALKRSRGKYVLMLGDDDGLSPSFGSVFKKINNDSQKADIYYLSGLHYCYPNVMPGVESGYGARVFSPLLDETTGDINSIDLNTAKEYSLNALNLRHHYNFNAQHFLLSRKLIQRVSKKFGSIYKSPYPDFYSAIVLFNQASSVSIIKEPTVIIGISPKSFGAYYFSGKAEDGFKFLDNKKIDIEFKPWLTNVMCPGDFNNTNWLIAAETARRDLKISPDTAVDLSRYRSIQLYSLFKLHFHEEKLSLEELEKNINVIIGKIINPNEINLLKKFFTELGHSVKIQDYSPVKSPPISIQEEFRLLIDKLIEIFQNRNEEKYNFLSSWEKVLGQYPAGFYEFIDINADVTDIESFFDFLQQSKNVEEKLTIKAIKMHPDCINKIRGFVKRIPFAKAMYRKVKWLMK